MMFFLSINFHHVVAEVLQAAEPLVAHFARENRVHVVLWTGSGLRILPRGDLVVADHLLVVLRFLHMFGQQIQASKTCSTTHALQDIPRLLFSAANPNILKKQNLKIDYVHSLPSLY